jgi:cyclophilin family peptidyl-prolyl cis-trans isomerase
VRRTRTVAGVAVVSAAVVVSACAGSDDVSVSSPFDQPSDSTSDGATDAAPTADIATPECPPETGTDEVTRQFDAPPPDCLDPDASYSALVETSAGDITIELDQTAAPEAVNSFVFLARNNYFDDTVCHRVIQEFVVQCGDPTATGTGGPGYRFPDELTEAGSYQLGSIAMANSGPDTNGSQFFIISGPNGVALPPLYSNFGQVPEDDLGVVADMNALGSADGSGVPSEEIRILDVTITQT